MNNLTKITLFSIAILLFYLHKSGDLLAQNELGKRRQIESALVLLKNETSIIPIKKLDKTKIQVVSIGLKSHVFFREMCAKYTDIEADSLRTDISENQIKSKFNQLKNNDLNIISISNTDSLTQDLIRFIEQQMSKKNTILCFFDPADKLHFYKNLNQTSGLVLAHHADKLTQELTAQLLFGGIGAIGRLPTDILPHFRRGDGLKTENNFRLKYTIPEEVGWNSKTLHQRIDSVGRLVLTKKVAPNCQILVAKNGKIIFHKAYGFHTYAQKQPIRLDDLYDMASVSKITTALPALMKLHGENQFDLEAKLSDYLPYFADSDKDTLRFRPMLAHQARLTPWIPYWQYAFRKGGSKLWQHYQIGDKFPKRAFRNKTFKNKQSNRFPTQITKSLFLHKNYQEEIFRYIKESKLLPEKKPEKKYVYSGVSFFLYPTIIEKITQTNYETYLNQNFYHPLGAKTLVYNPLRYFPKHRILPTEYDSAFRKQQIHGIAHDEGAAVMGGVSANAGLFGNANDLAKLIQMYLQKGYYGGKRYIAEKSLDEFTKCHYCNEGNRRGLGFDKPPITEAERQDPSVSLDASAESFGHSGFTGTYVWADPKHELIFIFLSNRVYPTRNNRKLYQLNIRPTIHQILYDMMN